jgi:hemolysin III
MQASEITPYSLGEEIANAVTHGLGTAAAIVALTLMMVKSAGALGAANIAGVAVYGASLIILFLCSTLYHSFGNPSVKAVLKRLDHSAIFVLIAGTYTPFLLITLQSPLAHVLLFVIWGMAITGVLFKVFFIHRLKRASLAIYLLMGWLSLLVVYELYVALPTPGFALLVAGGLAYSIGAVFYAAKNYHYTHAIWHLFVLGGAACHCVAIAVYVIPSSGI